MKIKDVILAPGRTGFFFDDQLAIKEGAISDGSAYLGRPQTPGFTSVRQAGESVLVMLRLEDGQVAFGDCAAVQYSGAGGRDPLFLAEQFIPVIEKHISPLLIGADVTKFRPLAEKIENLSEGGNPLHTAIRYGVSQAILDAAAKANREMMCETAAREYNSQVSEKMIPIFTQSGDQRYENTDKMILKGADVLPHGLINNVPKKLGLKGELLLEYVAWVRERALRLRPGESYAPVLHFDVYGTLGLLFGNKRFKEIAAYIGELEKAARPFKLRVEGPVDAGGRDEQIEALASIRAETEKLGVSAEIVADEWCNTLEDIRLFTDNKAGHMAQIKTPDLGGIGNTAEAVLYCKEHGMGAYVGGTCNETDRSGIATVHVAMAVSPGQILAKPGMGVDEGFMIVYNEMSRILALR